MDKELIKTYRLFLKDSIRKVIDFSQIDQNKRIAPPHRMEWRYGLAAHKVIAIDAGHVCQNLYLACEAIGAATCAIAAYDQGEIDKLLRIDGQDEFTIYLASVGKKLDTQR